MKIETLEQSGGLQRIAEHTRKATMLDPITEDTPSGGEAWSGSGLVDRLNQQLEGTPLRAEPTQDGNASVFDSEIEMTVDPFIALSELQKLQGVPDVTAVWDALSVASAETTLDTGPAEEPLYMTGSWKQHVQRIQSRRKGF